MPIPLTLAWGWFLGGWLKGLAAGAIVGAVIVDPENQSMAGSRAGPEPLYGLESQENKNFTRKQG